MIRIKVPAFYSVLVSRTSMLVGAKRSSRELGNTECWMLIEHNLFPLIKGSRPEYSGIRPLGEVREL